MNIVTFYSYKGGVGRTLALVNTAYRLAQLGKKVFIVDFDLEAPGISSFSLCGADRPKQGLLDYIGEFLRSSSVSNLNNFVSEATLAGIEEKRIFVMHAGEDSADYQRNLGGLDWKGFYKERNGYLFVENLKEAIRSEYSPDYVLIDSRTGLTDITGICTLQLPHLVVMLFNLNTQNIKGTAKMWRSIRFNTLEREINILLVASPVPDTPDASGLRSERLAYGKKEIGAEIKHIIPYDAKLSYKEMVVPSEVPMTALTQAYDTLANEVIALNPKDVITGIKGAQQLREQGNMELATLQYQELVEANPSSARAWSEYGLFMNLRGDPKKASQYFMKATELQPEKPEYREQLTRTYLNMKQVKPASDAFKSFLEQSADPKAIGKLANSFAVEGLYGEAIAGFKKAAEISGNDFQWSFGLAQVYMQTKQYDDAVKLYQRDYRQYPSNLAVVYNLAYAKYMVDDPEAFDWFLKACEIFEKQERIAGGPRDVANGKQAMSHAYMALGRIDEAVRLLTETLELAEGFSPDAPVFSPISYKNIAAREFVKETRKLLKKAEKEAKKSVERVKKN